MTVGNQAFRLDQVDFDSVYQGGPLEPGGEVSFELAPWDIGGPQPVVERLADSGEIRGEVLDVGCGLGDNAIFLAGRGHRVTGVDGARSALDQAAARARERGVEVTFVCTDVTEMDGVPSRFETVLDSALYHCLPDDKRDAYAEALWRVTVPGARLHLFCFSDAGNDRLTFPMSVTKDDLRRHLSPHWDIEDIEPDDYTTAFTTAMLAGMHDRLARIGIEVDLERVRTDDQDRMIGQVWHLTATRA